MSQVIVVVIFQQGGGIFDQFIFWEYCKVAHSFSISNGQLGYSLTTLTTNHGLTKLTCR